MAELYVVATPIGNLNDLSPRMAQALADCHLIAAEDTRVTMKLLNHLGLKKPMVSYYRHNTQAGGQAVLERLLAGESCALVTDAGTPAVSDPGEELVALCARAGVEVVALPGPRALITALAVSGAHIVLFTTGRGTPFASPVPTVKISSNSALAGKKNNWIDFNAGRMVEDRSMEELAQELFDYVLAVASGKKVKAEEAGFHDMAIFKQGVTL